MNDMNEMNTKIGRLAGRIWKHLDEEGEVSYARLRRTVVGSEFPMPDVALSCALGWLARENKVHFSETGSGRGYRIRVTLVN